MEIGDTTNIYIFNYCLPSWIKNDRCTTIIICMPFLPVFDKTKIENVHVEN